MSHLLAARCTVCGVTEDPPCPECPGRYGSSHGTTWQQPFSNRVTDTYVHQWHPECIEERA